ncbi:MAG: SDR family oxidoreductase, partial [Nitrospiria bacterium]
GSVDFAEKNYAEAYMVNCAGTENILWAAKDYRSRVVYISTNAVFDGYNGPYSEVNECHPVNAYGSIKRQAEVKVMAYDDWVIIRPFLLYGWPWPGGRQNWVTTIINRLSGGQSMKLVNDVIWQPTYIVDCARTIWQVINSRCEIYHVAADERVNLYEFGLKVAKVFGLDATLLEPVRSDSFPGMATRPPDTSYKLDKITSLGIKLADIGTGLRRMKRDNG